MFVTEPITGADLPDGHLVLTYDDGPGPNTLAVAEYLSEMAIEATFFVVGESMQKLPDVPARVHALGHRLGNHTWTHYYGGLTAQLRDGGDIVEEMTRTTARLDAIVGAESLTFRPPYGYWDAQVAAMLNAAAPLSDRHVGPFNWRIPTSMDLADWKGWRDGFDPAIVATWYRAQASTMKKGIVLLHDYTAEVHNRAEPEFRIMAEGNRSAELTRALVPMLIADGFRFVSLHRCVGL